MKIIITGGAGFIGVNVAKRYLDRGDQVVIVDNLSRPGADKNADWLRSHKNGDEAQQWVLDISGPAASWPFRDHPDADRVLHLAGQTAVTTSISNPRRDFEVNALGTLNVLEAMREAGMQKVPMIYASTNKVYGALECGHADHPDWAILTELGVDEYQSLDFHSPYGCSKGAGDQYTIDYRRVYGLNTIVFRQSCIYGPRQAGTEDQGWISWFMKAAKEGKPITVYGDGKQMRDVLWVDDLVDAYEAAFYQFDHQRENPPKPMPHVYNIGGGPQNVVSVRDVLEFCCRYASGDGIPVSYSYADWRPGDQKVYVSDISRAKRELGWEPKVGLQEGLRRMWESI
jgi:CDP-paratose 2-epimerase